MKAIKNIYIIATLILLALNTEIDFGTCLNTDGDGKVYNADAEYNYISYARTDAQAGDKIITVFFLNPTNTEPDDYIYRHDYIIR